MLITLDAEFGLEAFEAVAVGRAALQLGEGALERLEQGRRRMRAAILENRVVYGVTTGFGALADRHVAQANSEALQRKLVYHLATGVGRPLSFAQARGAALARLSALAQGRSGVSEEAVDLLLALINAPLAPLIPEKGAVGASGDLTPLAHLALALMGEGAFFDWRGRSVANEAAFAELGASPLKLSGRDGLALVNGTSAMTAIAALNGVAAGRLFRWQAALTVAVGELLGARTEAWRAEFAEVRPHPGQRLAAEWLRSGAEGSQRLESDLAADSRHAGPGLFAAPQDAYTLRCAPQVLGAALDALSHHDGVIAIELNAATDNPILLEAPPYALHGGNFMGAPVALASDALRNAVATVAGLAERQLARLCNEKLNGGLPAFLHRGIPGLDSGFMGAQVTASALLAEIRAGAAPASIQSIPTNADNQDVVSMGTIAARACAKAIEECAAIQAILALAAAQGMEICAGGDPQSAGFGRASRQVRALARSESAPLSVDRPLSGDISRCAERLAASVPS